MRWHRSSEWSSTTSHGTKPAKVSAYPGRSSRLSPRFGNHSRRTPRAPLAQAKPFQIRSAGSENLPATSAASDKPCKPPRSQRTPPVPSDYAGILRSPPHTTCWGYLSQADTHPIKFNANGVSAPRPPIRILRLLVMVRHLSRLILRRIRSVYCPSAQRINALWQRA
jgi:hypothetical protein